jgi:hypothetical protein
MVFHLAGMSFPSASIVAGSPSASASSHFHKRLGQVPRQFPSSFSPVVIIVQGGDIFKLLLQCVADQCGLFKANPALLGVPYAVRSNVPPTIFPDFVAALEDKPIETTSDNIDRPLLPCDEFGATDLTVKLTGFRESTVFREVARREDRDA